MITTPDAGFEQAVQAAIDATSNPDEVNQLVLISIALSLKRLADHVARPTPPRRRVPHDAVPYTAFCSPTAVTQPIDGDG